MLLNIEYEGATFNYFDQSGGFICKIFSYFNTALLEVIVTLTLVADNVPVI